MRRGLALILVVGVLGVLAVLGAAFAVLGRMERRSALHRLHATRAVLLARSGIEDAFARLDAGQDPQAPSARYLGEDWDASAGLNGQEVGGETFRPGRLDTETCPLGAAMRCTWFAADSLGKPQLHPVEGKPRGFSGRLGLSSTYSLKVFSGGFYVNGGALDATDADGDAVPNQRDPDQGYNRTLRRMFGTLAEALDREDGVNDGLPVDEADGFSLIDSRPPGGWKTFSQIRAQSPRMAALEPYLALEAWVDLKVIAPHAGSITPGSNYPNWLLIKKAHVNPFSGLFAPPDFERVVPGNAASPVTGRAPVSLPWARRHRPALIALLAGLKGVYLDESAAQSPLQNGNGLDAIGALRGAELVLDWSQATDEVRRTADAIQVSTSELSTWDRWDAFCDTLVMSGGSDLFQAKRDLLKANFNPNSRLNKFNPDPSQARLLDKSDLQVHSTEFDLVPHGGERMASLGRVMDRAGRVLARATLMARRAPDRILRLTTQSELEAGSLGRLDLAGDEAGFRTYGETGYLSEAQGPDLAFGHRLALGGFLDGDSGGVALQTWPEPHTVSGPATYDGQVRLATLESPQSEPGRMFLARWGESFDADVCGGDPANAPVIGQWETGLTPANPLYGNPSGTASPGMLYPDGLYLENGANPLAALAPRPRFGPLVNESWKRQPGYAYARNCMGYRGTVSFWCKPSYDISKSSRGHHFLNGSYPGTASLGDYLFWLGHFPPSPWSPDPRFVLAFRSDTALALAFNARERKYALSPNPMSPPHRWRLLTFNWDMALGTTSGGMVTVDRGTPPNMDSNALKVEDKGSTILDLSENGGAFFFLGRGRTFQSLGRYMGWPDATLDEFSIYDFGPDASAAQVASQRLASTRFQTGRYYREARYDALGNPDNTAGTWASAPIALGGPVRLLGLSWSQVIPREMRAPAGSLPEDGDPGPDGAICFELLDGPGTSCLTGRPLSDPVLNHLGSRLSVPFRLHAIFQPNLADSGTHPILDPLALDDVTLVYARTDEPRFRSWASGEAP